MENKDPELTIEVLPDDYTQYDLSFKLIVIGDSSKNEPFLSYLYYFRCWEILFNYKSN